MPSLGAALRGRPFRTALLVGLALSLPWHVRNWIVCGNPVYAFFPEIFGGKNINPAVLESAFGEWRANGDGIGVVAPQLYGANTLWLRLRATWRYFVEWQSLYYNFWKLAPVFVGFALPGALAWLLALAGRRRAVLDDGLKFGLVLAALLGGFLFYFYVLGDFYLYQIIAIVPVAGLFAAYWPLGASGRWARGAFGALVLAVGVMPGLAASLMGPKLPSDDLYAFRQPLMETGRFYRLKFPLEAPMWDFVNANLKGRRLLTHENRHLMIDPSITLVHLDDWEIQPLYDVESPHERAEQLKALGVRHYLRIPMESKHAINRRLGMDELLAAGRLRLVHQNYDERSDTVATLFEIE
jgi:hypothetical protein